MRLQQYMAACGVASRRASEKFIVDGRVSVNGHRAELGQRVDPNVDRVTIDGKPLATESKVYILLNKPRGIVTSAKDTHHRKTVLDCVQGVNARLFPVGRLDMDVGGAIILTNDGDLAYRLMHPKFEVEKVYEAWVQGDLTRETVKRLEQGVQLEDGMSAPAKAAILSSGRGATLVQLTLHEGRNREVKRMCEEVGHPVLELKRVAFGLLQVRGLRPGEWRHLVGEELTRLLALGQKKARNANPRQ